MGKGEAWYAFADRADESSGSGPQVRTATLLRMKPHVHQRLVRLSGIATVESGKRISLNALACAILEEGLDAIEETISLVDKPQSTVDGGVYTPPRGRRLFGRRRRPWPPEVVT